MADYSARRCRDALLRSWRRRWLPPHFLRRDGFLMLFFFRVHSFLPATNAKFLSCWVLLCEVDQIFGPGTSRICLREGRFFWYSTTLIGVDPRVHTPSYPAVEHLHKEKIHNECRTPYSIYLWYCNNRHVGLHQFTGSGKRT